MRRAAIIILNCNNKLRMIIIGVITCCLLSVLAIIIVGMNKRQTILFLGDSITYGYVGSTEWHEINRFSTIVCKEIHAKERNYSLCGSMISNIRDDGSSFVERASEINETVDSWIIVGGGY